MLDWGRRLLVCPWCRAELEWLAESVRCQSCRRRFPLVEGVPVFADPGGSQEPGDEYKRRQTEFFDGEAAAFEESRPTGAPALYGRLMEHKFDRSLTGIGEIADWTALVVCGGSGMDAEFLARAGARVIVSDIALGAVLRAQTRAKRRGLEMMAIVADAERLPLSDGAVALSYVHDGLHHLADPMLGVAEMARVTDRALSITEPAQAAVTKLAMALGVAQSTEEAGNDVNRLRPDSVQYALARSAIWVAHSDRYFMYYRHQPGPLVRLFSRPRLQPLAWCGLAGLNRFASRIGNKLTLQAVRVPLEDLAAKR